MSALQIGFPDTFLIISMYETVTFTAKRLEITMTLFYKKLT